MLKYSIYGRGKAPDAPPVSVIEDGVPADELDSAIKFYDETGDYSQVWARDHSAPSLPVEVEDQAREVGIDTNDATMRSLLAGVLMEDEDLFGDWDRSQFG